MRREEVESNGDVDAYHCCKSKGGDEDEDGAKNRDFIYCREV